MSHEKLTTPSDLRELALETAALLRAAGHREAGGALESAAKLATSSGWEWLGELGAAVADIGGRAEMSADLGARPARIREAATSRRPYG